MQMSKVLFPQSYFWSSKPTLNSNDIFLCIEPSDWNIYNCQSYNVYKNKMRLCAKLLWSCRTLCNTMDHSPTGSSVHGILQARILKWVAIPSSRGSSGLRDRTLLHQNLWWWVWKNVPTPQQRLPTPPSPSLPYPGRENRMSSRKVENDLIYGTETTAMSTALK